MDILCFVRFSPPLGANDGPVRPEDYPHREGCVRDKWEAQKPTTALASGFGYLLSPKVPIKSNYLTDSIR